MPTLPSHQGLGPYPLDGVVAVVEIVQIRVELPVGVIPSPDVLGHEDVAVLGPEAGGLGERLRHVVVRSPAEDDGKGARLTPGKVDVGREVDAVPHGYLDIVPGLNLGIEKDASGHLSSSTEKLSRQGLYPIFPRSNLMHS